MMNLRRLLSVDQLTEVSTNTPNISTLTTKLFKLPVFGLPGKDFLAIHITACVSLGISLIASFVTIVFLIAQGRCSRVRNGAVAQPVARSFWQWPVGERLVLYLALFDLTFSFSHTLDHAYMLATRDHVPKRLCQFFAFLLNQTFLGQWGLVLFTAVNAFSMVVLGRKLSLGRYDWRLLLAILGIPLAVSVAFLATGLFGPSGAWCFWDYMHPDATVVILGYGAVQNAIFVGISFCYAGIWIKVRAVPASGGQSQKYRRSAKVMVIFVLAFILQYWSYPIYTIWSYFEIPPFNLFVVFVFFVNFGGVFNGIAYTLIRRRIQQVTAGCGRIGGTGVVNHPQVAHCSSAMPDAPGNGFPAEIVTLYPQS